MGQPQRRYPAQIMTDTIKQSRTEQTAAKVRLVRKMLCECKKPSEIKAAFAKQFGLTERAAERFLTLAREEIRSELNQALEDHRGDSYLFWMNILEKKLGTLRDQIRARENLDKLLGTHAPIKTANTDTTGRDVPEPKTLSAGEIDAILQAAQSRQAPPAAG